MKAISELWATLAEALREGWQAADLPARLRAWWWVVRHPQQLDAQLQWGGSEME